MTTPKASILSWRPERDPGGGDMIKVACPLCGHTHGQGAGAGVRTAHCMVSWRTRSYEIGDEDFARRRYISGDWSIAVNPYRTDRELVRQMRKTLGWQKVPFERLERLFGEWLYQRHNVGEIRALSPTEFDTWLRGNEFMDFIRDRCFTERRIIYLFQLKEVFAALRKPIRDELQKAAAAWFKRGMA